MLDIFAKSYPDVLESLLKPGESCIDDDSLLFIIHWRTYISSIATMCGETTMCPLWKKLRLYKNDLEP